jgi:pyrroloquinoline quinone biosynthesis protein D
VAADEKRLAIAASARLRWDPIDARHVLLSPERGLALSETATEVVRLCDGTRTASDIVRVCVEKYSEGDPAKIDADVRGVLSELRTRRLVVEKAEG